MMLTWGDSPMSKDVPAEWHNKICHATFTMSQSQLAGVDDPFEPYEPPKGFQLLLELDNSQAAERVFSSLVAQGSVKLPIQQTFWASRYGIVIDRFGIPWEISCGLEAQQANAKS